MKRVLVVDDDADWREYVRMALADLGYEAIEAASGEEGLRLVREQRPDIMLLDLHMPGMDGREVLEHLPARGPRVVLVTAASDEVVTSALSRGGQYYLPKGSTREALSLLLESLSH